MKKIFLSFNIQLTFSMNGVNFKDDTKLTGEIKDLTIYSSYFAKLKHSNIKYRVRMNQKINKSISYIY